MNVKVFIGGAGERVLENALFWGRPGDENGRSTKPLTEAAAMGNESASDFGTAPDVG